MFYLALSALKLLAFPLSVLPRPLFLRLGRLLGLVLRGAGFRRDVVEGNITLAFPAWSPKEKEELLRRHYAELGVLFLELLRMFYRFDRFFDAYTDVEGAEHLGRVLEKGRGAFVMTAHIGNWELLTLAGKRCFGSVTHMVTKELKPGWLHRSVAVTRELLGVRMACEPRTMQGILRGLRANQIVGMVMDQYAGAPVGARVPFFGVPVGSHTALAALAARTGVPVVPAIAVRRRNGRYLVRFEPPLELKERASAEEALIANTAMFVRHTEAWVREYPAQWLWIHRRWKGDLSALPPQSEGEMLR